VGLLSDDSEFSTGLSDLPPLGDTAGDPEPAGSSTCCCRIRREALVSNTEGVAVADGAAVRPREAASNDLALGSSWRKGLLAADDELASASAGPPSVSPLVGTARSANEFGEPAMRTRSANPLRSATAAPPVVDAAAAADDDDDDDVARNGSTGRCGGVARADEDEYVRLASTDGEARPSSDGRILSLQQQTVSRSSPFAHSTGSRPARDLFSGSRLLPLALQLDYTLARMASGRSSARLPACGASARQQQESAPRASTSEKDPRANVLKLRGLTQPVDRSRSGSTTAKKNDTEAYCAGLAARRM